MPSELHIICTTVERQASRLDFPWPESVQPDIAAIHAAATAAPTADRWVLSGGEPTLRADLPQLIAETAAIAPSLGMRTDGLLLSKPGIDSQLHQAGLQFVRIPLHSGRADAHDWLVRLPGASKRVRKALDLCTAGPLEVEAEIALTRPTTSLLLETVSLLVRHGVSAIHMRFLECQGPAAKDYIALSPRLAQLHPQLEGATRQALRHGVAVRIEGVPLCAAPSFPECHVPRHSQQWATPDGVETPNPTRAASGCPGCPGAPTCSGPSADYADLFGWTELQSEGGPQARQAPIEARPRPTSETAVPLPPVRAGRAPATRLRNAIRQSEIGNIGGDPMAGRQAQAEPADVIAIEFPPESSTRELRLRLVRAAQHGANTLRIQGPSLLHPEAHDLLREAQRLSFRSVEVWGDGSAITGWSDVQIRHLRGLSGLYLFENTSDPAATQTLAERVSRLAGITVEITADGSAAGDALVWTDETGGTNRGHSG